MEFITENLGKIGFEWKMAVFNLINFLILFWILKKYFFAPIVRVIDERNARSVESEQNFKKAETEVAMAERTGKEFIANAKKESTEIIARAGEEAGRVAGVIKDKAQVEVQTLISEAKKTINAEKQKMMEEMKDETADLVVLAVEKVLSEKTTSAKDKKFVSDTLSKLS